MFDVGGTACVAGVVAGDPKALVGAQLDLLWIYIATPTGALGYRPV